MRKSLIKMDREFRLYWKNYVVQSLLASLSVFIVIYFLSMQDAVIIASIGATTFIVYAMPQSITAQARNVIGGHLVGLFCGFLFSLIPHPSILYSTLIYSLAVGISMFIMVVTDTEHPPAAGTALGIALSGITLPVLIVVVVSIVLLSAIHRLFKPYLRDLT
ncbi:MAG: HPP family protein [Deltaproteobacteria bacterium]|nr:HPP family protein [Deltaproteobacteria bacterium]